MKKNEMKLKPSSFEIICLIGSGAFGRVYLVRNWSTNKHMAMKVLSKSHLEQDQLIPYAIAEKEIM